MCDRGHPAFAGANTFTNHTAETSGCCRGFETVVEKDVVPPIARVRILIDSAHAAKVAPGVTRARKNIVLGNTSHTLLLRAKHEESLSRSTMFMATLGRLTMKVLTTRPHLVQWGCCPIFNDATRMLGVKFQPTHVMRDIDGFEGICPKSCPNSLASHSRSGLPLIRVFLFAVPSVVVFTTCVFGASCLLPLASVVSCLALSRFQPVGCVLSQLVLV